MFKQSLMGWIMHLFKVRMECKIIEKSSEKEMHNNSEKGRVKKNPGLFRHSIQLYLLNI